MANHEVAQLVEDLAAAVGRPGEPHSLRTARASRKLGAVLCRELLRRSWVARTTDYLVIDLTEAGARGLAELLPSP